MTKKISFKEKKLKLSKNQLGGRNNRGRITSFHRGSTAVVKNYLRIIDFRRNSDYSAIVRKIFCDSSRSAFVALITYQTGVISYIIASNYLKPGNVLKNISSKYKKFKNNKINYGFAAYLNQFPIGSNVFNIGEFSIKNEYKSLYARSAGTTCKLLKRTRYKCMVRIPSLKVLSLSAFNRASFGFTSNRNHKNKYLTKAGENRNLGKRPVVRGVAMNPVDHPHGGNTSGGKLPVTPWGILTKGYKTKRR